MADGKKQAGPTGAVRSRMVEGAARLLATKGVEGTSFAGVLAATDSPRGSVYHHFPGGKPELLHAALGLASERGLAAMEATRGLRDWLWELPRWPEVVTHEELNLRPPPPLAQLILRIAHESKRPKSLLESLKAASA